MYLEYMNRILFLFNVNFLLDTFYMKHTLVKQKK